MTFELSKKQRLIIVGIARSQLERVKGMECRCCEKVVLSNRYKSIIEKAEQSNRFTQEESYMLVEFISDRIEKLKGNNDLELVEQKAFEESYTELIKIIHRFTEAPSVADVFQKAKDELRKKQNRENKRKNLTPVFGPSDQSRIEELNQEIKS